MRRDVGDAEALEAVSACGLHARTGGLVKADGHVQFLADRPERVVRGVVPRKVVVDIGPQEDRFHAKFADCSAGFLHSTSDIMGGDGGGAEHPLRVGGHDVIMEPIIVRPARSGREARVHPGERGHVHRRGRIEDRQVEPLLVHRPHLGLGIEIARDFLGITLGERGLLGIAQRRPVAARHLRHDLALDQGTDVPAALVEPPRRARTELGIDVALPQISGLHHVHLGVDQLEAIPRHDVSSPSATITAHGTKRNSRGRRVVRPSRRARWALLRMRLSF